MRLLVLQYSYQSLLFRETVDKLLSRFPELPFEVVEVFLYLYFRIARRFMLRMQRKLNILSRSVKLKKSDALKT